MNDRVKTITLLLLVFAVFGLAGWRVAGAPDSGKGEAPPPIQIGTPSSSTPSGAAGPSAKKDAPIEVSAPAPEAGTDPFRTAVGPSTPAPAGNMAQQPRSVENNAVFTPMKGDIAAAPETKIEVRPDVVTYQVKGIVSGDKACVIIRCGDRDCVLSVGDYFGDNYQVKAVTSTQVIVQEGKRVKILSVSGF